MESEINGTKYVIVGSINQPWPLHKNKRVDQAGNSWEKRTNSIRPAGRESFPFVLAFYIWLTELPGELRTTIKEQLATNCWMIKKWKLTTRKNDQFLPCIDFGVELLPNIQSHKNSIYISNEFVMIFYDIKSLCNYQQLYKYLAKVWISNNQSDESLLHCYLMFRAIQKIYRMNFKWSSNDTKLLCNYQQLYK